MTTTRRRFPKNDRRYSTHRFFDDSDHAWRLDAACLGQDHLFFPEYAFPGPSPAKQICNTCPVQQPCLDYALTIRPDTGIWAGYNAKELRKVARERRKAAV